LKPINFVLESVHNVIEALRDPNLRKEAILQELITSALQTHTEQVEIMPQITSLMPWSLNFAEQSNAIHTVLKFRTFKKKVVKFDHFDNNKTFFVDLKPDSVFFVTGDDTGPAHDSALSRIAQDFVSSRYDFALLEIDIGVHMNDLLGIVSSDALTDILKIVTSESSFHKEEEILRKIEAKKAMIFVKGMRFASSNEMIVIDMVFRIVSKVSVPLFISTVNKFLNYAIEKVGTNRADDDVNLVELSPPNKPQFCQLLKVKLKLNRNECEAFLAKGGYKMTHGTCFASSNVPIICELLDSEHDAVSTSNLFSLYETHTAQSVTKFTAGGENVEPAIIFNLITKESLKIFGFNNDISTSDQEVLQRASFTCKTKTGKLKFRHELLADYLISKLVIGAVASALQQKPSTQEILTEHRFFQARKFLDSYLAQDKHDDVEYNACCATLKSALKEGAMAEDVMENMCDEGLFYVYQCLRVFPSEDKIDSCLRRAIQSNAQLASALVEHGANLGEMLGNYPDNGILHDLAMNGACDLMMQALRHYAGDPQNPERIADWRLIKTLLNENEIKGCSPLHLAAERGHADMVKLLIEYSASVTLVDNETNNWTALHYAVLNGHREATEAILTSLSNKMQREVALDPVLELLLEKGTDPVANFLDELLQQNLCSIREYEDLLYFVVEKNRDQILHNFLRGRSAAFVAVEKRRPDILRIMEKCGIDLGKCDWEGWTTLHAAATEGAKELIQVLGNVPVDAQNNRDQTALLIAVKKNDANFVRDLLKLRNADASLKDSRGKTPLTRALEQDNSEIAKLLQEKSEIPFTESEYDQIILADEGTQCKILHEAAQRGFFFIAERLITSGLDPNCKLEEPTEGLCALHQAAASDNYAIVGLLCKSGADIYAETKNKQRAVHLAAQNGHLKCTKLLLEFEKEPRRTQSMHQALLCAAGKGEVGVVQGLLRMGTDPTSSLHYTDNKTPLSASIEAKSVECVTEILNILGDKAIARASKALHAAVMTNDVQILQCLIEFGANINEQDDSGYTPVCLAVSKGFSRCVDLLLNLKPDLHLKNSSGMIPFDYLDMVNIDTQDRLANMTKEFK
jgi:ankyrin repeat protein